MSRFGSLVRSMQLSPPLLQEHAPNAFTVDRRVRKGLSLIPWDVVIHKDRGSLSIHVEVHQVDT